MYFYQKGNILQPLGTEAFEAFSFIPPPPHLNRLFICVHEQLITGTDHCLEIATIYSPIVFFFIFFLV